MIYDGGMSKEYERPVYYDDPAPQKKKAERQRPKILGLTFLAVAILVGSTFATRINLNTGSPVEFGQGVVMTIACSGGDTINVKPVATYDTPTATYLMSNITFSHIPDSCLDKGFAISAYKSTVLTPLSLDTGVTSLRVIYTGATTNLVYPGTSCTVASNASITDAADTAGYGTFNLKLDGVRPHSGDVDKLTVISDEGGCITNVSDGLTSATPGQSAYQILRDFPGSTSGLYWIQNASINSGNPVKIYADMDPTHDGGGWTLIVANSNKSWTYTEAQSVHATNPPADPSVLTSVNGKYSILSWADYIKKSASGFQYRIDADSYWNHGGVWTANGNYSFMDTTGNNTNVTADIKWYGTFFDTSYLSGKFHGMPFLIDCTTPANTSFLTTTRGGCTDNWWGTLIQGGNFANATVPWISDGGTSYNYSDPTTLWYWVR